MICRKQPNWIKLPIRNTWEVQLNKNLWVRIQTLAHKKRKTYSWIVRYCTFRLIRQQEGEVKVEMVPKPEKGGELHRHQLCLYGDDELLLRTAAWIRGLTVTAFVRLALEMSLCDLEADLVTENMLLYFGVKLVIATKIHSYLKDGYPIRAHFTQKVYSQSDYW